MFYNQMNILITGGSGFIGSSLLKILKYKNLFLISSKKRKKFIKFNLNKPNYEKLKKLKIDVCVHLAWSNIPDYSKQNSFENYLQSKKLFHFLYLNGCKKIISTGSCWEYKENYGKKSEKYSGRSENIFGYYKKKLSIFGQKEAKKNNAIFTWFRIFYVYGDKKKGLLKHLESNYKKKNKFKIKYPYKLNDFISIYDLVKYIKRAIQINANGTYNLGTGDKKSTLNFCRSYCEIKNIKPQKLIEYNIGEKQKSGIWADMKKTNKKFKIKASTNLKRGIRQSLIELF